ncbi:MAG TPA: hypothetical protein PJ992_08475 [Arachnia sp.]|nr:hypothetical protein [Arachnia sp.]
MKRQLVFLPIAASEMGVLSGEIAVADRVAYTVTPRLLDELGYGENESEDAEYASLVLASVAALTTHGERLVVVAEVDPALVEPGDDPDNGQIVLTSCPASAITAWFADEPGADVADAAAISKGLTIDQAWDLPQVQALLQEHDLLWNDVVEYRRG